MVNHQENVLIFNIFQIYLTKKQFSVYDWFKNILREKKQEMSRKVENQVSKVS